MYVYLNLGKNCNDNTKTGVHRIVMYNLHFFSVCCTVPNNSCSRSDLERVNFVQHRVKIKFASHIPDECYMSASVAKWISIRWRA